MPKAIISDARNIILKVETFFEYKARAGSPIIPFNQIYKRISAVTGVSHGLISKIVKEGQKKLVQKFRHQARREKTESDNDDSGMEICRVWPHNQDEVVYSGSSIDHNYC